MNVLSMDNDFEAEIEKNFSQFPFYEGRKEGSLIVQNKIKISFEKYISWLRDNGFVENLNQNIENSENEKFFSVFKIYYKDPNPPPKEVLWPKILDEITVVETYSRIEWKGKKSNRLQLHSFDDFPASVSEEGLVWCVSGQAHRENDLPSVVSPTMLEWTKFGQWHRENGPSIKTYNKCWWHINHKLIKTTRI